LHPQKIRSRLQRLHQQIEAGSPRPEFELAFDPLGLIAPALKPFAEGNAIEEEQPLTSPDRTMRVLLVVTNQRSFSDYECMRLIGMGFSLLLSCLVALALGLLIFGKLNMVTVGFCAILVGLGVDFAILIFGRYQQARGDGESHRAAIATSVNKLGRAVFFGALTTAVGFLALILRGSLGFTQLGVLIAIGILFAGLFMCTILFLFVRERQAPVRHDWLFDIVKKYVRWSVQRPLPV